MGGVDKLLLPLKRKPLLVRTVEPFLSFPRKGTVVVAVNPERVEEFDAMFREHFEANAPTVTAGGEHRQESILLALRKLQEAGPHPEDPVLIHDGARPFVTRRLFDELLAALERFQGVIPAAPVRDTVKRVSGDSVVTTEDRETLRLVQTPQAFQFGNLLQVHEQAATDHFVGTDDASLLEREGQTVGWVSGPVYNLKITVPEDLAMLEHLFDQLESELQPG